MQSLKYQFKGTVENIKAKLNKARCFRQWYLFTNALIHNVKLRNYFWSNNIWNSWRYPKR